MGISIETLAAAKKFTSETVLGGGAVVGKNVTISSITPIDGGNRITFSYTLDNGTTKTSTLDVMNGKDGKNGSGSSAGEENVIESIKVNGIAQTVAEDKSVDITVPTVDVDKNYVDGEVSSLKEDIVDIENLVAIKSPNLFDPSKLVNKSISDTGTLQTNANAYALLNIPITYGQSIVFNGFANYTDIWYGYVYNSNDKLISRFGLANYDSSYSGDASWGHYGNKYTAVEEAKYFNIYTIKTAVELGSNYQLEYGDTLSAYKPYGTLSFKYADEINEIQEKQNKLIAGKGISIDKNIISCTIESNKNDITYFCESKLINDTYGNLPEITNPTSLLFAENNVVNKDAIFLFGNHKIKAENNYFIISQDKSYSITSKSGSLEIAFEYDGISFEIGNRGLAKFRFRVDEGNGWKYLNEIPLSVSTQNGYRTYTQIRFLSAKHRKIVIETTDTVWCLRYDANYQVSPLTFDRPLALFVGSSITEGSAAGEFPNASYGAVCCRKMGWEYVNIGVGSRGMVTSFESKPSILESLTDITQFVNANYIFIGGSINDSGATDKLPTLQSGIEKIVDSVRTSLPNSTIILLGTWSPQPDSNNSAHISTNNIVKTVALNKNCAFIDSMNAIVYDKNGNVVQNGTTWVTGTFTHASGDDEMSIIGNCARIYNHENGNVDHTHPGRIGHYYIGMRLASACRALKLN